MSNITSKETEGVSVVSFNGRIVLGFESAAFRECVKSLLSNGGKKIVLNMSNVTYIDSSGLGMLVALHVSANNQSAELHLSNLGGKFKDVLQLTRLFTVFNVFSTEVEAVRGFRPAAISA
jgi:anti-sigma B factor antagonist